MFSFAFFLFTFGLVSATFADLSSMPSWCSYSNKQWHDFYAPSRKK
jgi:hypothetical protein